MPEADVPPPPEGHWQLVAGLGVAQIISWGSIYYAFAVLLEPLERELGASRSAVAGAFSVALLASGLCVPWFGSIIDRAGGRGVMTLGSLGAALLLALLSSAHSLPALYAIWAGLGVIMAATLYEPAFVVIAQSFRANPRRALTVLTLFGGFASTVFWPLTTWLVEHFGWRDAVLFLAAINLIVCMPLHAALVPPRRPAPGGHVARPRRRGEAFRRAWSNRRFKVLALAFLAHYVVVSAVATHLIALLLARGLSPAAAAGIGALIGPMQVVGRVLEFGVSGRLRIGLVGRIAALALPAALAALAIADTRLLWLTLFAMLYGAGNGAMTVVRAALPVEMFGREDYGAITGALAAPGLIARAAGPFLAAVLWTALGGYEATTLVLMSVALFGALAFFQATRVALAAASQD